MGQCYWSEGCEFHVGAEQAARAEERFAEAGWTRFSAARSFGSVGDGANPRGPGFGECMRAMGLEGHYEPDGSWTMDAWACSGSYSYGDALEERLALIADLVDEGSWIAARSDESEGTWVWSFAGGALRCEWVEREGRPNGAYPDGAV